MKGKRIIPCLDIDKGRVVKGVKFADLVDAGDPIEIAKAYESQGADELVLLNISATEEGRKELLDVVEKIAGSISIPLIVGGGIKSVENFRQTIESGADKVSIGSATVYTPSIITECAEIFGSPTVVASIDVKQYKDDVYSVYIEGGKEDAGLEAIIWARTVAGLGAGEILLTGIDKDGTKSGYDIGITRRISEMVKIPVIASGGAGKLEDFYDVFTEGKADAALAASLFHFGEVDIKRLKQYLVSRGIRIRKGRAQKWTN
ncbi:MAG: imidazole glycerol phosphate synthase subunit HisF [Candidatus Alkaliphilus sp. MAG34]|nr:imidazole glycerol phosphate synthase subunit HisF [Clostridiales bacterium]